MERAVELAGNGMRGGDGGPFGAVVVREGKIVGEGWNRVLATNDPTAHGEVVAGELPSGRGGFQGAAQPALRKPRVSVFGQQQGFYQFDDRDAFVLRSIVKGRQPIGDSGEHVGAFRIKGAW